MRRTTLAAGFILIAALAALPQPPSPVRLASERHPTNDALNAFPHFTPLQPFASLIAIDSSGTVHGMGPNAYINDKFERRGSPPFVMFPAGSGNTFVAVTSDDVVHAVGRGFVEPSPGDFKPAFLRRARTGETWGAISSTIIPEKFETFPGGSSKTSSTQGPFGLAASSGATHALMHQMDTEVTVTATTTTTKVTQKILVASGGGYSPVTVHEVEDTGVSDGATSFTSIAGLRIAASPSGSIAVGWSELHGTSPGPGVDPTITQTVRVAFGGGTTTIAVGDDQFFGDVAVDSGGGLHVVWIEAATGAHKVRYRGAATEVVSSATTPTITSARIATDSQNRAHVFWVFDQTSDLPPGAPPTARRIAYAARISGSWRRREGFSGAFNGAPLAEARVGPRDQLAFTLVDGQTGRSYEPNIGAQDAYGEFAMGPGASANVTTGNLSVSVPIFSSRGVGFATGLALAYNSLDDNRGSLGPGWIHNYTMTLDETFEVPFDGFTPFSQAGRLLRLGDGRAVRMKPVNLGIASLYIAQDEFGTVGVAFDMPHIVAAASVGMPWLPSKLGGVPGDRRIFVTKHGTIYIFDLGGRLRSIRDSQAPPNDIGFTYSDNPAVADQADAVGTTHLQLVLTSITDSAPRTTLLTYDSSNRLETVVDPGSGAYVLGYTGGKLTSVAFSSGTGLPTWGFDYVGGSSKLSLLQTPRAKAGGYAWSFTYADDHRVTRVDEPMEESVIDETGPDAPPTDFSAFREIVYDDSASPLATIVDRRGNATSIEYQYVRAIVTKLTDPFAKSIERTFDGTFRNTVAFKDKRGFSTTYAYHALAVPLYVHDNLHTTVRPDGDTPGAGTLPAIEYTFTTDGFNRVHTVTDSRGALSTHVYDGSGNLKEIQHPLVVQSDGTTQTATDKFDYDTRGRVERTESADGRVVSFQYLHPSGLVSHIRRGSNVGSEIFDYDTLGNTTSHKRPASGTTTYELDALYRVERAHAPPGDDGVAIVHYFRDVDSNVVKTVDPQNGTTEFTIDRLGRPTETKNAKGDRATTVFDREENVRRLTDFRSSVSIKTLYDKLNRVVRQFSNRSLSADSRSPGGSTAFSETEFEHDPDSNVTQVIAHGAANRATERSYDARRNVLRTKLALAGLEDVMEYDANDSLTRSYRTEGGAFNSGNRSEFDARNRVTKSIQLRGVSTDGPTTKHIFDRDSNRVTVIDPLDHAMRFVFDDLGRQTETKDALNVTISRTEYDESDRRTRQMAPDPVSGSATLVALEEFEYNDRDELKKVKDAFGVVVQENFYDLRGNMRETKDALGVVAKFEHDELSRVVKETRNFVASAAPSSTVNVSMEYGFDANSNRTTTKDANGRTYTTVFDAANQMQAMVTPLGKSEFTRYNEFGEKSEQVDANGKVVTFEHDALGRTTLESHGAPYSVTISREWDASGNRTRLSDGTFTEVNTFDELNRMTGTSWFVGATPFRQLGYEYLENGLRSKMLGPELKPDSTPVETVYDYTDNDQLQKISVVASPAQVISEWTYDAGHRKQTMILGNGAVQTMGYDAKERLASIVTRKSDTTVLSSFVYSYNARDERTGMALAHLSSSVVFGYDALGRLNAETWSGSLAFAGTYGYDPAGNRNFKSTPAGTFVLGLDADNRATSESVVSGSEEVFGIPVVDSTKPGHSSSVLNDGDLSDSPSANKCWRSGETAVQHFAGLALFSAKPIGKVILYIPTQGNRGMRRFKIQVGDGATFTDAAPTSLIGASPSSTPGWLMTEDVHEVTIEFAAISGNHVRALMDVGGGSSSHPNTMWLNEFRAFSVGATTLVSSSEFDENGSMASRTTGSMVESYTYTYRNELATYTKTESAVTTASFSYSFGPRAGDRINKMNVLTGITEWYMMEDRDVVADYETSSSSMSFGYKRRYVNGLGFDSKLARMEAGGTLLWYSSDAIGSVSQTLDDSQSIVNRQQTNAWGEDLEFSQAVADRHGFSQRERDSESGLVHYRARSYDPRIGRFVQRDPAESSGGKNRYSYVDGKPTQLLDPTGEQSIRDWQATAGGTRDSTSILQNFIPSVDNDDAKKYFLVQFVSSFQHYVDEDGRRVGARADSIVEFWRNDAKDKGSSLDSITQFADIQSTAVDWVTNRKAKVFHEYRANFIWIGKLNRVTSDDATRIEAPRGVPIMLSSERSGDSFLNISTPRAQFPEMRLGTADLDSAAAIYRYDTVSIFDRDVVGDPTSATAVYHAGLSSEGRAHGGINFTNNNYGNSRRTFDLGYFRRGGNTMPFGFTRDVTKPASLSKAIGDIRDRVKKFKADEFLP